MGWDFAKNCEQLFHFIYYNFRDTLFKNSNDRKFQCSQMHKNY